MVYTVENEASAAWCGFVVAVPEAGRRVRPRVNSYRSPYWILVEESPLTVFTLKVRDGSAVLPVFSSLEEALCFVFEAPAATQTLKARETGGGELISLLYAPLRGVRRIALDPPGDRLPEALELVCVGRGVFLDRLLRRGRS